MKSKIANIPAFFIAYFMANYKYKKRAKMKKLNDAIKNKRSVLEHARKKQNKKNNKKRHEP